MNLKNIQLENLPKRVICFLIKDDKILLGQRKEGMGEGNFVGIGGKLENNETNSEAIKREVKEEIGIEILEYKEMGSISFLFPHKPKWSQTVIPFICTKWEGTPSESEEIYPKWFKQKELPIDKMWADNKFWIPIIAKNKKVNGIFIYNEANEIEEHQLDINH